MAEDSIASFVRADNYTQMLRTIPGYTGSSLRHGYFITPGQPSGLVLCLAYLASYSPGSCPALDGSGEEELRIKVPILKLIREVDRIHVPTYRRYLRGRGVGGAVSHPCATPAQHPALYTSVPKTRARVNRALYGFHPTRNICAVGIMCCFSARTTPPITYSPLNRSGISR